MAAYSFGSGLSLDPGAEIQKAGEVGKQSKLASLLGQAYSAPQDQQRGLLGQAAMLDPYKTAEAQKAFSGINEDNLKQFAQRASMASSAFKSGNVDLAQSMYSSLLPHAKDVFGDHPFPAQMDAGTAQAFDSLTASVSGKGELPASAQEYVYAQTHPGFNDFRDIFEVGFTIFVFINLFEINLRFWINFVWCRGTKFNFNNFSCINSRS